MHMLMHLDRRPNRLCAPSSRCGFRSFSRLRFTLRNKFECFISIIRLSSLVFIAMQQLTGYRGSISTFCNIVSKVSSWTCHFFLFLSSSYSRDDFIDSNALYPGFLYIDTPIKVAAFRAQIELSYNLQEHSKLESANCFSRVDHR